jgi:hypothetical protein
MNFGQPTTMDKIKSAASDIGENVSERFNNAKETVTEGFNNIKENIDEKVNDFSSSSTVTAASNFLDMNTTIAKFAFLILVVVGFLILFNLGMQLIGYMFTPSANPYLIKGQIPANSVTIVSQDPKKTDSITIPRSNNAATGIEFTWSVWISYAVSNSPTPYLNIFNKGDNSLKGSGKNFPSLNNAPGVYFGPASASSGNGQQSINTLWILMDTIPQPAGSTIPIDPQSQNMSTTEYIEINNIPINKYFHLAIRCENKFIDVYINGTVVSHTNLVNVPKQNYYDVNIGDGNFQNSYISNLRYYSTALSIIDINNIVTSGPNTTNAVNNKSIFPKYIPNYLSSMWYQSKIQ